MNMHWELIMSQPCVITKTENIARVQRSKEIHSEWEDWENILGGKQPIIQPQPVSDGAGI